MTAVGECSQFYRNHRGASGACVVVRAHKIRPNESIDPYPDIRVFGSIETAQSWRESLGDSYACIMIPYIIDDPDWGNESTCQ